MKIKNNLMNALNLILLSIIYTSISGCMDQVCLDEVSDGFVLTDELAISLSQSSLKSIGMDISKFEPIPYSSDGKFFAHSEKNKNDGYILWHEKDKKTKFEYSVSIEKKGSKIYCDAGKTL